MFTGNNSTSSSESLWEEIWLENTPGNQDILLFPIALGRLNGSDANTDVYWLSYSLRNKYSKWHTIMKVSLRDRRGDGPCNKQLQRVFRATLPGRGASGSLQVLHADHSACTYKRCYDHLSAGLARWPLCLYLQALLWSFVCSLITCISFQVPRQA